MAANPGTVAPVSVKTSMSYDDSKVDDFERKSMGSDEGSDDYKVGRSSRSRTCRRHQRGARVHARHEHSSIQHLLRCRGSAVSCQKLR